MDIEFFDGRVRAWAHDRSSTAAAKPQSSGKRGSGGGDTGQGSLFG
jgi:hypothetical protein